MSEKSLESYVVTGSIKIIERFFDLPLDYSDPNGKKIRVFARSMVSLEHAESPEEEAKLPYFVYLQGGPGFEVDMSGYLSIAASIHKRGYQTLWLDQRGTGLSTPFSANLVSGRTDKEIFQYLKHFRADNIVRDCEAIRKILLGSKPDEEDRKWTILGQSFGGFCTLTYLSFHPEGLKEVFITAGLPPLVDSPDTVYRALEQRVLARNATYYQKYPGDVQRVRDIIAYLDANVVTLPNGGTLTPNRFLQLGMKFGSQGGIDDIHQIVFRAVNDLSLFGKFSQRLLQNIQQEQALDGNPLYAVLHESIYCQGRASRWSAERVVKEYAQHSWKAQDDQSAVYFFGEMIFPDMLDDYSGLRPLKGAAQLLAEYTEWPPLYDEKQLSKNTVKVTAATYYTDMYVDFDLAQATVSVVKNIEQYISNQHMHSALRRETETILEKLFQVSKREYD